MGARIEIEEQHDGWSVEVDVSGVSPRRVSIKAGSAREAFGRAVEELLTLRPELREQPHTEAGDEPAAEPEGPRQLPAPDGSHPTAEAEAAPPHSSPDDPAADPPPSEQPPGSPKDPATTDDVL